MLTSYTNEQDSNKSYFEQPKKNPEMYIIILIIVIIHKKERKNKTFNIYYNIPTYKHDKK